jgi:nucleotide-binding universal stress UspA family protein
LRVHAGFVLASAAFTALFVTLVLSAFHAPAPHDVPVGIVAPARVTGQVADALDGADQGGFDLHVYGSEAAARTGIEHRQVDGALIAAGGGLHLLVAQAGGTGPAQALTGAFEALAAHSGRPLAVTDVAPPRPGDTEALSPFFVVLGVLIPSVAGGSASALLFRRSRRAWSIAAPVVVAVAAGAIAAGLADGVAGLGHYAAVAGIVALFSLAVAAPTAALGRIFPPLVSVGVLVFIMFGIPASGGPASLGLFGPGFLRALHPALPLGAGADAVRGAVYFDGYGAAGPLWVLTAWAAAGMVALTLAVLLRRPIPVGPVAPVVPAEFGPAGGLVVGFDNSEPARRALSWAARQAAERRASVHVVFADHQVVDSDLAGVAHPEMEAEREQEAATVAGAAAGIMAEAGLPYTFERRQEGPADAILAEADAQATAASNGSGPVIVVGRSGHAARHLLGSVPTRLLHRSPYPVLTIP